MTLVQIWLIVSVVGLALVFSGSRRNAPPPSLQGADWLIFAAPFAAIAIPSIGTFFSVNTSLIPLSGDGLVVALAVPIILTAFGGLLLAAGRFRLTLPAASLSLLCALGAVSGASTGRGTAQPLIGIALAIGVSVFPGRPNGLQALARGARAAVISIPIALLVLIALSPSTIGICRADKCSVLTGAVLAIGDSGNIIGLFLLALVPLAAWGLSPIRLVFFAAFLMVQFDLAAARSAMIGLALCLATLLIAATSRPLRPRGARLAWLPTLIALALSLIPVFGDFDPSAYTTRGALWNRAHELIADSPIVGHGPSYWSAQTSTSELIPNYSPHNIWLEIAVSLGILGVIAVVLALVATLFSFPPESRAIAWSYIAAILGAGMLEATFTPYRLTVLMSSLPVFLVLLASTQLRARDADLFSNTATLVRAQASRRGGTA